MKKLVCVLMVVQLVLISISTKAQDSEGGFSNSESDYTKGMGGPIISFSALHGEFAMFMGGGGGVILKDFILGVYGMGQATQIEDWNDSERYASIWHGGLWLGYTFFSSAMFHPTIELNAGMGNFSTYARNDYSSLYTDKVGIFVVSPKVGVEFNASNFVRIGIGAEYRYVTFTKPNSSFTSKDLSAPAAYITLKLGEF